MLSPTPPPPSPQQRPPWVAVLLFGLLLVIANTLGGLVRPLWSPLPIDAASTPPTTSASVSSGPAFDATASAALVEMAHALSTSVAPTATPSPTATPRPTYAVATAIPNVVCGTWVPMGSVCEMPLPPKPSPTPMLDCPVEPREMCVWRGTLGLPVPTPVSAAGAPWSPT
jgi:hypothetical protein